MFKNKLLLLLVSICVTIFTMLAYSIVYTAKLKSYNELFVSEVETRSNYLNAMITSFGYGHTIHNFKNLVIRGESQEKFLKRLELNREQFYTSLNRYVAKVNEHTLANHPFSNSAMQVVDKERTALKEIKITYDVYADQIKKVIKIRGRGGSIAEIDSAVKVNDAPALRGFHELQLGISLLRMEVINQKNMLISMLDMGILIASIILAVLFFTSIMFSYQMLNPIIKINNSIKDSANIKLAVDQYNYPYDDEVGQLIDNLSKYG